MRIFFVICVLISGTASAVTLTWEDCVRMASESNPDLIAARNDWLSTQQNERIAVAGFLPSVSAQTSVTQTGSTGAGGGGSAFVSNGVLLNTPGGKSGSQVNTNYIAALNLKQNLFNGMEDYSRYKQSQARSLSSYLAYEQVMSTVTFNLKQAFANLIYTQEALDLARTIQGRRESNFKLVSVRYENGRENKGSVLLAEAYYEQAKLDVIRANDSIAVAKQTL
ncbi:MAG: TolC family protein, partial [Bacteriovoracaceae bacterium]